MKTYYWTGKKNFGDLLTPLLLKKFGKLESELVPPEQSELVMVGSILEHLPKDYEGYIFGSGKLHEKKLDLPRAKVISLRGPLTAKDFKGNFTLGDPALLADELVPIQEKKYNLGIVPHWTDTSLEFRKEFLPFKPKIIRVSQDPLEVIAQIGQCKKIVSSSLHGIILADAFGIPRRIEISPSVLEFTFREGGLFKWMDYSLSLNMELKIGVTQEVDKNLIIDKQHELFDLFEELKGLF